MSTFYLIRHGQNDYLGRALAGRLPVELNAKGHQEAKQLAQALKEKGITRIFSSPIRRAVQTAEPIAEALKIRNVRSVDLSPYLQGFQELIKFHLGSRGLV